MGENSFGLRTFRFTNYLQERIKFVNQGLTVLSCNSVAFFSTLHQTGGLKSVRYSAVRSLGSWIRPPTRGRIAFWNVDRTILNTVFQNTVRSVNKCLETGGWGGGGTRRTLIVTFYIAQMKHQLDATLCRFYFCRVTLHVSGVKRPSSGVLKKLARQPLVQVL
jgi:hypothetical protein